MLTILGEVLLCKLFTVGNVTLIIWLDLKGSQFSHVDVCVNKTKYYLVFFCQNITREAKLYS
jgi:hypothetical protein